MSNSPLETVPDSATASVHPSLVSFRLAPGASAYTHQGHLYVIGADGTLCHLPLERAGVGLFPVLARAASLD